jgi:hypothetical protein
MRVLLLLLLTAITISTPGQQINGLAKEESGTPLNGATVSLIKATTSISFPLCFTSRLYRRSFYVCMAHCERRKGSEVGEQFDKTNQGGDNY